MFKTNSSFISLAHISRLEWKGKIKVDLPEKPDTWFWAFDVMEGSTRERMLYETEAEARSEMNDLMKSMTAAGY